VTCAWVAWLALCVVPAIALAQPDPDPPAVAVLPFRVHSAKPIDYLGESLANLVASRLEASGRVRVLDPAAVEGRLDPAALRETRDSALRAIAEELAADYLVTGSLTELAGRYSLDVRVTPAAIGLESQTLVLTAERDDALLARVNEVADGVIEHVGGAAPALVTQIQIEGAGDMVERLLAHLASRVGEPYDAAAVRDDLAMLRGKPEIASAGVGDGARARGRGAALPGGARRAPGPAARDRGGAGRRRRRAPSAARRSPGTCAR
jgi:TolB-like protein